MAVVGDVPRRQNLLNAFRLCAKAQLQIIRLARQQNRAADAHEDDVIDLEDRRIVDAMPDEVVIDHLERLRVSGADAWDPDRSGKADSSGLRQTKADRGCHDALVALLEELYPGCVVVGEESTPGEWNEWFKPHPVGQVGFHIDAIDGSSLHDCLGWGFSSNLLMYVMTASGDWHLVMVSIVNSSGDAVGLLCDTDSVFVRDLFDPDDVEELLLEPKVAPEHVRPGFIATVAAMPRARRRSAVLLDSTTSWGLPALPFGKSEEVDPPLTVTTAGGAPATYGMAALRLEGLITTDASTVHDACGLLVLVALGIPAYWVRGASEAPTPITLAHLKEMFANPPRPHPVRYKRVPPHVVCRDEGRAVLIAKRLDSSADLEVRAELAPGSRSHLRVVGGQDLRDDVDNVDDEDDDDQDDVEDDDGDGGRDDEVDHLHHHGDDAP
ncbi:hypothetical protein [Mycolicibacterium lacusdiani]|uniref:hypothetical protein n=1 Tax=Mycolicibacterium lacusdiani TaxID=2895283 RepID=UPI001F1D48E9|nr:hypothetical protein [Mycolicibacterium lacusdiani]